MRIIGIVALVLLGVITILGIAGGLAFAILGFSGFF